MLEREISLQEGGVVEGHLHAAFDPRIFVVDQAHDCFPRTSLWVMRMLPKVLTDSPNPNGEPYLDLQRQKMDLALAILAPLTHRAVLAHRTFRPNRLAGTGR